MKKRTKGRNYSYIYNSPREIQIITLPNLEFGSNIKMK